jgi:hypothetical protein
METGAPFFFGDGLGVGAGVSLVCGIGVALGDSVGVSVANGVGETLRCFFADGIGDSSGVGVGVGEIFLRSVGDTDGLGLGVSNSVGRGDLLTLGFADGVGDGDNSFFFVDIVLRCFRGAGVGVGWKILLILSANDSSAASVTMAKLQTNAAITRTARGPSFMSNAQAANSCSTA